MAPFRVQKHMHVKKLLENFWISCNKSSLVQQILLKPPDNNGQHGIILHIYEQCNKENNQLLLYWQKYEFSFFADQILASTKNTLNYRLIYMPGPTPHLLKIGIRHYNLNLMNTLFWFPRKKQSKYTAISMHMLFSVSPFTISSNARLNPNLKMTLDNSHNASFTLK